MRTGTVCGATATSSNRLLVSLHTLATAPRTPTHLVRRVIMPAIKVFVQKRHKARVPASTRNEGGHVLEDVKRVDPLVALRPARVFARPLAARVACLHEARVVVEDAEGVGERAVAEEGRVLCVAEQVREDGDG